MPTITLRLSDESVLTIPKDLAQKAGLDAGEVQVILDQQRMTVVPIKPTINYALLWQEISTKLQEQAAPYLVAEDRRDEEYWDIVASLLDDAEHQISSI